jgi:antitoxin (DNA-binding transcriptional repressor) of toxin-antitoxin stability system
MNKLNKKDIRSTTEVRANFQDVIDNVHYTRTPLVITKRNKPWAIIYALPEDGSFNTIEQIIEHNKKYSDEQFKNNKK